MFKLCIRCTEGKHFCGVDEGVKRFFARKDKKVIFFDMNRTLLDPDASFREAFIDVLEQMTGRWDSSDKPDPDALYSRYSAEWSKKASQRAKSAAVRGRWRQECLAAALEPAGLPAGEAAIRAFFRKVKDRQSELPVAYPQVAETVRRLSEHYRLAVLSNGSKEKQLRSLKQLKLISYFQEQHLFSSSDFGLRKPHTALFRKAAESIKVSPSAAVMVGNSWKNDVSGAVGAGMDAIWLHSGHTKKSSQRKIGSRKVIIIRRFEQLLDIFE